MVKKVSIEETDHICLIGLSEKDIEREKQKLIKMHLKRAIQSLTYSCSETVSEICRTRLFFVQIENNLVLCGVYYVHEKRDSIGEHTSRRHEVYDYLLFCEKEGFYFVNGCSAPLRKGDESKCVSPTIYLKSYDKTSVQLLNYGETYQAKDFEDVLAVHNVVTHISYSQKTTDITVLMDTIISNRIRNATMFCELPLSGGYILYTNEIDHMRWFVPSKLMDCFSGQSIDLLCRGGYSFSYNSDSSLTCVMADTDNKEFRTSDEENYYFYISKTDTVAFDEITKCVRKYGTMMQMNNLCLEDSSVNYKLAFSKNAPQDVLSFVYGVISKSKVLYPLVFGCPIHDVVEVLCRDSLNNPYELPKHSIDETSAQNIIDYIKARFGLSSNSDVVHLLAKTYGSYATLDRHQKYWAYFHGELLRCEYLPTSLEETIGKPINGQYVKNLEKSNLNVRWKSEHLLYRLVYSYFPDATLHYTAPWLGLQHLDIFIPSLSLGVEYQGQQHYESSSYFGGTLGFDDRQFLDNQKRLRCKENNVALIEWPYTLPISSINLIQLLSGHGINRIPVPDPFRPLPQIEESIPEEKIAIAICQFSESGAFLRKYSCYQEAANACGISAASINKAVNGYNKTAGGFQWRRYLSDQIIDDIVPIQRTIHSNQSMPVLQISPDGEIIAEFSSIGSAEKATGVNRKSIRSVLNGVQKEAGGFLWTSVESSEGD